MTKHLAVAALSFATLAAQPAIHPPQIGFAAIADGSLRPVYGVAGNFILGSPVAANVLSEAFSGSIGLLKSDSTLTAFNAQAHVLGSINTAPGRALFAFTSDGATALAYLPSSDALIEWSAGKFAAVPFRPETSAADVILAIALPNALEASLIVQRSTGIWEVRLPFSRTRAASQQALTGVTGPVLALASGDLVYGDAQGIVLRKPDDSEVHIAAQLPASFSLQQMDSGWIQLVDAAGARRFAIRITPGREAFYQLPESGR
jgi:hypothetical protein